MTSMNGIIFHPGAINYSVKFIWLKGQRNTRSMMNIIFVLLAKRVVSDFVEGVNYKIFHSLCLCV